MSHQTETLSDAEIKRIDQILVFRMLILFVALVVVSLSIMLGGRWLSRSISTGGYAEDTTLREVVIGNNVLSVPDNAIRFRQARRDGVAERLDLYLRWPGMDGFSNATHDDFNGVAGVRDILFLSFEPRSMPLDMSARYNTVYRSLIVAPGQVGPNGIALYAFKPGSGYDGEKLAVAARPGASPFVARCLSGQPAAQSLAPCERDIAIGDKLTLSYRFPADLLGQWRQLDAAVSAKARSYLETAN